MRQTLLFLALHLLGTAVCLGFGTRRFVHLCGALAFAVGLAVTITALVLVTVAGVPYGRLSAAGVYAVLWLAALVMLRRRGWPARSELRIAAGWTAAFTVVCLPVTALNVALLTPDSHTIIALGRVLVDDAGFAAGLAEGLTDRGVFLVAAHSLAALIGKDYLYSLSPMLGLTFVATFAICLWHGLRLLEVPIRRRRVVVGLVTGALFSVYLVQLHFVYIHENLPSAIYLFAFVSLFWLAEVDRAPDLAPVAFIALCAFALLRIENPLAVALFVAVAVLPSGWSRRDIAPGFAACAIVATVWNLYLAAHLGGVDGKLDATRALLMAGAVAVPFAYWLVSARWLAVNRRAPALVAGTSLIALVITFWLEPDRMRASAEAMIRNLGSLEDVALTWYGLLALAIIGLFVPRVPAGRGFTYGVYLYLLLILLLSYESGAYVVKIHDSAMRMSLHVLPLAFFYIGLKFALAGRAGPPPQRLEHLHRHDQEGASAR